MRISKKELKCIIGQAVVIRDAVNDLWWSENMPAQECRAKDAAFIKLINIAEALHKNETIEVTE